MPSTYEYRVVDSYLGSSEHTYNLSDGTYSKDISLTGIGIVEPKWIVDTAPTAWYSYLHGLTLLPRNMNLRLFWQTTTEALADQRRDDFGKIFKPFDPAWESVFATNPVKASLRINRAGGTTRQIDCYPTGLTDMPTTVDEAIEASRISGRLSISLIAPDPTFYDPSAETYSDTSMSGSGSGSFSLDIEDSTWFMYPKLTFAGPFTTIRVYNAAFGSEFTLNSVPDATTVIVDTSPNVKDGKRIYNSSTKADLSSLLDDPAEGIAEFYIPPEWYNNGTTTDTLSYSYTGGDGGSSLAVAYNKRFVNA